MHLGKMQWAVLVAGLLVAATAFADGPQTPQERLMIEKLKAAYQKQGLTLTPEREEQMLQRMRQMQANAIDAQVLSQADPNATPAQRAMAAMGALRQDGAMPSTPAGPSVAAPATATATAAAAGGMTSEQLLAAIAARHAQGAPTVFQQRPDGFIADGKPVIDPLGRVVAFGGDSGTGDVSYFVQTAPNQMLVRFANVHSSLPPVTVGTLTVNAAAQAFTSMDGKQVGGDTVIPAGQGVVVARDSAIFGYDYGKDVSTQPLPSGYRLASYQRGDVAGTGYVLLRRDISAAEQHDAVQGVVSLFKSVAGKEDSKDYALFNVHSGHLVYLNMDEIDEQVGHGVDCHAKSAVLNKCNGWQSHASIFTDDGRPNFRHYFWRATWMPTADGPTAVALEGGVKSVDVIRLDTDQRATVFHRALGIERFTVDPLPNGSLAVTGDWAFSHHVSPDVRTLFTNAPVPKG